MSISLIEAQRNQYAIYNERGEKEASLYDDIGRVIGWGDDWFIAERNDRYFFYDDGGRKYKEVYVSDVGDIECVSSDTFVTRRNGRVYTYDQNCNKIAERYEY